MPTDLKKSALFLMIFITALGPGSMVRADDCEEAQKWYHEGLSLSDNSEREVSYYQKAIELCPHYFEAHNKLGEVYKRWGEFELAMKEFELASRSPTFSEPYFNMGEIYRMQGRYDLAVEAFTKALKMDPAYRQAQNQLQYVEKRLGVYDSAEEEPPEVIPISIFGRIPGMTLPKGSFVLDFQYKYWPQKEELSEDLFVGGDIPPVFGTRSRDVDVHVWILGLRYGLTNNWTIGVIPKFFFQKGDVKIPRVVFAEPEDTGFGDTVVLTKYRLWSKRRTHLSAFHLLSIPTGDEDAVGKDRGIVRTMPLGSGDFSFGPGLALTTVMDGFTLQANVWGIISGGDLARQAGDEFRCDLSLMLPRFHNFMGTMELNYRWQDSTTREILWQTRLLAPRFIGLTGDILFGPLTHEATILEKGGHTLFVSPGAQVFLTDRLKLEVGMQIPVMKPDGWAEDFVAHVGLMKYFW